MNMTQSTLKRAKRLLPKAPAGPPCFEAQQVKYILSRFEGTAGRPFAAGAQPDAADERGLITRLGELCREIERRLKVGQYA